MLITNNKIQGVKLDSTKKISSPVPFQGTANSGSSNNLAKVSAENLQAYTLTFLGKGEDPLKGKKVPKVKVVVNPDGTTSIELIKGEKKKTKEVRNTIPDTYKFPCVNLDDAVQEIKGKDFQGAGLFDGGFIDWNKVGWDKLSQEPLDWDKAKDKDLAIFYHALALAETKDHTWVRRYNETNVPEPLASYHKLVSSTAKQNHAEDLNELRLIADGKIDKYGTPDFLNKPLMKDGKFNMEFTIFDTETTGAQTDPKKGPVDKIIQIGAVRVNADGSVQPETAVSQFINPEMPIHPEATKVHHIADKDVADKPVIEAILKDFMQGYVKDQMLVAYNAKFDIPMLNRGINSYNAQSAHDLTDSPISTCMDPYVILQRIHPFLGASKRLSEQYKYLFGHTMEGAHDALDDVKGTVDVLKYCCYYLQKHANRPLTVKDVLTFQFGGKVEGLDIQLNSRGYDESKSFRQSYRKDALPVINFSDGWKITEPLANSRKPVRPVISELLPLIGEENANKLMEMRNKAYKTKKGFVDNLKCLELKPYDGKNVNEIIDIILEKSVNIINKKLVKVWRKNVRTDHLFLGNDMPDMTIARQVMKERAAQDKHAGGGSGRPLDKVLTDMRKG